jgi:hypothetical protein
MSGWQDGADAPTWAVLQRLADYGLGCEQAVETLESAATIIREMSQLEQSFQDHSGQPLLVLGISVG